MIIPPVLFMPQVFIPLIVVLVFILISLTAFGIPRFLDRGRPDSVSTFELEELVNFFKYKDLVNMENSKEAARPSHLEDGYEYMPFEDKDKY